MQAQFTKMKNEMLAAIDKEKYPDFVFGLSAYFDANKDKILAGEDRSPAVENLVKDVANSFDKNLTSWTAHWVNNSKEKFGKQSEPELMKSMSYLLELMDTHLPILSNRLGLIGGDPRLFLNELSGKTNEQKIEILRWILISQLSLFQMLNNIVLKTVDHLRGPVNEMGVRDMLAAGAANCAFRLYKDELTTLINAHRPTTI